jgi:fluoroquinolone transport system permease protein
MNHLVNIYRNDLRQSFRDRMMIVFLFLPLIMIGVIRILLPLAVSYYPAIEEYQYLIVAMLCGVAAIGPGYLSGFLMLNEKDSGIFEALRVLPVSAGSFLTYRVSFITILGFIASVLTLSFSGLQLSAGFILVLSLQIALFGPIITLLSVTFARNKIEGVTLLKGLNFFFAFPLVVLIIDPAWKLAAGIFPYYWTYMAINEKVMTEWFWIYSGIGMVIQTVLIVIVFNLFRRRVF